MHCFFEDDGQLKTGTIRAEAPASLQVDLATGRRVKIKTDRVMLRFDAIDPLLAMKKAQEEKDALDLDFLWEASPEGEFSFERLAQDYYGEGVNLPQKIAMAISLYHAPIYFYKKGRGIYKKAPIEALNAARASLERKAREAEQIEQWKAKLLTFVMPDELRRKLSMLLYQPDKNSLEYKAFNAAVLQLKMPPVVLADRCGVIPSSHEFHFNRFLSAAFPSGVSFPALSEEIQTLLKTSGQDLPLADVAAFSIDDKTTTEFDDAFSLRAGDNDTWEIGIHIAVPTLAITRDSELDAVARQRLSTVYMPGRKITMLPEATIEAFTLKENTMPPALSLYITITAQGEVIEQKTVLNRITMAKNYAFEEVDLSFADETMNHDPKTVTGQLAILWKFARVQSKLRGKAEQERAEFSFYIDWEARPDGAVTILPRLRGSPLDRLIAECAIYVNNQWGIFLAEHKAAGLYRTKTGARVRMSTKPGEHQGLGVSHYLWATSPLRRYTDVVNQQQLLAVVAEETPPFSSGDADLFGIIGAFESTYKMYAEFQSEMERYWCLRWLTQEKIETAEAVVLRRKLDAERSLVRLTAAPLTLALTDLPRDLSPGTHVLISIVSINPLFATISARFKAVIEKAAEEVAADEDLDFDSDDAEGEALIEPSISRAEEVIDETQAPDNPHAANDDVVTSEALKVDAKRVSQDKID